MKREDVIDSIIREIFGPDINLDYIDKDPEHSTRVSFNGLWVGTTI